MEEAIGNALQCGVCHGPMQMARCLDCVHSFCEECIELYLRSECNKFGIPHGMSFKIKCPLCRQETLVQNCCARNLKPNILANNIGEALRELETKKPEKTSEHPSASAMRRCEKKEFYCQECEITFSQNSGDHYKHASSVVRLQDTSEKCVEDLCVYLERGAAWKADHVVIAKRLQDIKKEGMQAFDALMKSLNSRYIEQTAILRDAKDSMECDIKNREMAFSQKLDLLLQTEKSAMLQMERVHDIGLRRLASLNPEVIIDSHEQWLQNMEKALAVEPAPTNDSTHKLDAIKSLHLEFSPIYRVRAASMGTLVESTATWPFKCVTLRLWSRISPSCEKLLPLCEHLRRTYSLMHQLYREIRKKPLIVKASSATVRYARRFFHGALIFMCFALRTLLLALPAVLYISRLICTRFVHVLRRMSMKQIACIVLFVIFELLVLESYWGT